MSPSDVNFLADSLGYVLGAASLVLYTPIAVRVSRQKSADGLTLSTWWLKLSAYTCTDIYSYTHDYPLSTYIETLIITAEATVILFLVAYFQRRLWNMQFVSIATFYILVSSWALTAPSEVVALGQVASTVLNTGALLPQFILNAQLQSKGDYSPLTAGLAGTGCLIRLFTTMQLADADPILLTSFGVALVLNFGLLAQILWFGVVVEGLSPWTVLTFDVASSTTEEEHLSKDETDQLVNE